MSVSRGLALIGPTLVAAAAFAVPASAAGGLPVVAMQWTGFYAGGNIGGGWSDSDWRYDNRNYFNTLGSTLSGTNFGFDSGGVLGGGQVGYNLQSGAWVFGLEGSLSGADLGESRASPFFPTVDAYTLKTDLIASVTGRVGFAGDRWLVYAKAGWAGADVDLDLVDHSVGIRAHDSTWSNGWTAGGGVGYALNNRVSLAVEYDFADLNIDNWTVTCPKCGTGVGLGTPVVDGDVLVQSVTLRLNYRFGG